MFLKKFKKFFLTTKSWKNHPQKLLRIPQIHFFPLTASTAQMAQTEEIMFQNVTYWSTVYRTGGLPEQFITNCILQQVIDCLLQNGDPIHSQNLDKKMFDIKSGISMQKVASYIRQDWNMSSVFLFAVNFHFFKRSKIS